jgi:pimeloyl-ACP methyl ester carboxylesterase/DNA-binding CsgD family transcriptional regulator
MGPDEASALRDALARAEMPEDGPGQAPILNVDAIAAALVGRDGRLILASEAFASSGAVAGIDVELAGRAARGAGPQTASLALDASDGGETAIFAYARASDTADWALPPAIRQAVARAPDSVVVVTTQLSATAAPLVEACGAYGLSGLQTRVALATLATGQARTAAEQLGISYETAREALAEAMARLGVNRLPAMVSRLSAQAFGILPPEEFAAGLVADWGLTPRQTSIAALVAEGFSRSEAARALGVSAAVVKKELDQVYLLLQVGSAAALARKLVEARVLRALTVATAGALGFLDLQSEPLQFVQRPARGGRGGGRIAVSDYGPRQGRPVLVAHSGMTSRPVARGLLRALQAAGYRPISIDRPGYGLTDPSERAWIDAKGPFAPAAPDVALVMDRLKIGRFDIVARGAAQYVLAIHEAAPERLGRVVLVNPDPHTAESGIRPGPIGVMKQYLMRNPAMIRMVINVMARQATYDGVLGFVRRAIRGSPPDEAALDDPEIAMDYFRGARTFGTGRHSGALDEQLAIFGGSKPAPRPGLANWTVLVGEYDTMHDPALVRRYWGEVLPDSAVCSVPGTGRLLALSHPQVVVEALKAPQRADQAGRDFA